VRGIKTLFILEIKTNRGVEIFYKGKFTQTHMTTTTIEEHDPRRMQPLRRDVPLPYPGTGQGDMRIHDFEMDIRMVVQPSAFVAPQMLRTERGVPVPIEAGQTYRMHGGAKVPFVLKEIVRNANRSIQSVTIGVLYPTNTSSEKEAEKVAYEAARTMIYSRRMYLWRLLRDLIPELPPGWVHTRYRGDRMVGTNWECDDKRLCSDPGGVDADAVGCSITDDADICATCGCPCHTSANYEMVGTCACGCKCSCHDEKSDGACVSAPKDNTTPPPIIVLAPEDAGYQTNPQARVAEILAARSLPVTNPPPFNPSAQLRNAPVPCSYCGKMIVDRKTAVPCECMAAIYCSKEHKSRHMAEGHAPAHNSTMALKEISAKNAATWSKGAQERGVLNTPVSPVPGKAFTREQADALGMTKLLRTEEDATEEQRIREEYEARLRLGSSPKEASYGARWETTCAAQCCCDESDCYYVGMPALIDSETGKVVSEGRGVGTLVAGCDCDVGMPALIDIDTGKVVSEEEEEEVGMPKGRGGGGGSGRSGGSFGRSGGGRSMSPSRGMSVSRGPMMSTPGRLSVVPGARFPVRYGSAYRGPMAAGAMRSPGLMGVRSPVTPYRPGYARPWGMFPGGRGYGYGGHGRPWYMGNPYRYYRYPWLSPLSMAYPFMLGTTLGSYSYNYPYYDYYPYGYGASAGYPYYYNDEGTLRTSAFSNAVVPYSYGTLFDQLPAPPLYDEQGGIAWSRWWLALINLAASMGMVEAAIPGDWANVRWKTPNYGVHSFYWIPPSFLPQIEQAWAMQKNPPPPVDTTRGSIVQQQQQPMQC